MILATVSLWAGWVWVVFSVDPFMSGFFGFLLFYGVLFLALVGAFTLAGVFIRKIRLEQSMLFHIVLLSFRQSIVLAMFLLLLLLLQAERLLFWWVVLGLFLLVVFAEILLLKKERPSSIGSPQLSTTRDPGFAPSFSKKQIGADNEPYFELTEVTDVEIDLNV